MLSGRDFTILSLDLNQDEDEIITETDSASYNRSFFTDFDSQMTLPRPKIIFVFKF